MACCHSMCCPAAMPGMCAAAVDTLKSNSVRAHELTVISRYPKQMTRAGCNATRPHHRPSMHTKPMLQATMMQHWAARNTGIACCHKCHQHLPRRLQQQLNPHKAVNFCLMWAKDMMTAAGCLYSITSASSLPQIVSHTASRNLCRHGARGITKSFKMLDSAGRCTVGVC